MRKDILEDEEEDDDEIDNHWWEDVVGASLSPTSILILLLDQLHLDGGDNINKHEELEDIQCNG